MDLELVIDVVRARAEQVPTPNKDSRIVQGAELADGQFIILNFKVPEYLLHTEPNGQIPGITTDVVI